MHLFLNGGGAGADTAAALAAFSRVIDPGKPILYLPLAMQPDRYPDCLLWATGELGRVPSAGIEMAESGKALLSRRLSDCAALFIGGGNTFRLLGELRESGALDKIAAYLDGGGVIFGGSAGAILFGKDIASCAADDKNERGLADTAGLDRLGGMDLLCHYGSRAPERDAASREYLLRYSAETGRRVLALPERDTLYLHDGQATLIGDRPCSLFADGEEQVFDPPQLAEALFAGGVA